MNYKTIEQLKAEEAEIVSLLSEPDACLGDPYEALSEIRRQIRIKEEIMVGQHCAMALEALSPDIAQVVSKTENISEERALEILKQLIAILRKA